MKRKLQELSGQEVLALAISVEKSNQKALLNYSAMFDGYDHEVSLNFAELASEENHHEDLLLQQYKKTFKGTPPVMDPMDVEEVVEALDFDDSEHLIFDSLKAKKVFQLAYEAEVRAVNFYTQAQQIVKDKDLAALFKKLAAMEGDHAGWLEDKLKGAKS